MIVSELRVDENVCSRVMVCEPLDWLSVALPWLDVDDSACAEVEMAELLSWLVDGADVSSEFDDVLAGEICELSWVVSEDDTCSPADVDKPLV